MKQNKLGEQKCAGVPASGDDAQGFSPMTFFFPLHWGRGLVWNSLTEPYKAEAAALPRVSRRCAGISCVAVPGFVASVL